MRHFWVFGPQKGFDFRVFDRKMRVISRNSKNFWVDLALFADLISKKVLIFMFLMVKCASSCFELVISGLTFKTTGKNSRNVRSFTVLLMSGTICIEILAFFIVYSSQSIQFRTNPWFERRKKICFYATMRPDAFLIFFEFVLTCDFG